MAIRGLKIFSACAAVLVSAFAQAATWYVDDDNYGKAGLDGTTEATAFGTIVDATTNRLLQTDDRVVVLPGVYTNGVASGGVLGASRVSIDKRITLESRDGKDVTHIVGAPSPTTGYVGADAIRCVCLTHNAKDTVVRGFTLRDGYTDVPGGADNASTRGGAFFCNAEFVNGWLIDSVVSNCVSYQANVFGGTMYRCRLTRNRSSNRSGQVVTQSTWLHTCIVHDNLIDPDGNGTYTMFNGRAVNCTFAGNDLGSGVHGRTTPGALRLYNTVVNYGERMYIINDALISANCSTNDEQQLIAPALEDFRVLAGGPADGTGDLRWLTDTEVGVPLPPGEPLLDINGNPYPESGPLHLGAIQETVEAKGKRVDFNANLSVEGSRARVYVSYLFPTDYPKTYRVKGVFSSGAEVYGYQLGNAEFSWRFPEADGCLTIMPPPFGSSRPYLSVKPLAVARTLYVETPENGGSDTTGDGSLSAPYATIQKAVDAVTDGKYTIVSVGPGTYGEGEAHYGVNSSGVEVTARGKASVTVIDRYIRIVGREGAENTILKGTPDPDYASDATLPGCGPNAGRCALFTGDMCNGIQGFTLTGGHADRTNRSGYSGDYGGAVHGYAGKANIVDCIISNNAARVYGACSGGQLLRCFVTDNYASSGTVGNSLTATACVFRDNPSARNNYGTLGGDCFAYWCTVIGSATERPAYNISSCHFYNSIASGGDALAVNTDAHAVLAWNIGNVTATDVTKGNPMFVDEAGGDLRVKSCSPAAYTEGSVRGIVYQYTSTDFTGAPMDFTDGWPAWGAFRQSVDVPGEVYVDAGSGGVKVTGGAPGLNTLSGSDTLTVAPTNGPRPYCGYTVNGVTNLLEDLPGGALTVTAEQTSAAGGLYVAVLYDDNWYADAVNGDDENPGFSILPKKTLAATMALAISGDTVHAAPGDYNEGSMKKVSVYTNASRVVVASGVTLKADQGPDNTFITGADATVDAVKSGAYAGCGTNALRCVYLLANSRIEGFTLRHGRFNGESPDTVDSRSGGIYGDNGNTSVAYGCVITNCWGYRGGGCYSIHAINCRFIDNKSQDGTAGKSCAFTGCVFGRGYRSNAISNPTGLGVANCFFSGDNMYDVNDTRRFGLVSYASAKYPLRNCVILSTFSATEAKPVVLENCVLLTNLYNEASAPYVTLTDCIETNAEAIAVDEYGRPSAESVVIDHGDNSKVRAELDGKDAGGGQRIYNGNVDAGAYEYDWRGDYAKVLHPTACTVTNASPEVVMGEGKVLVTGTLDTVFAGSPDGRSCRIDVPVRVTGGGTLTVTLNGETAAEYTAADGSAMFTHKGTNACDAVAFTYAAADADTGAAEIGAALRKLYGVTISFR